MAEIAVRALKNSMTAMRALTPELAKSIRDDEELCDHYEDILGTYLVKLSSRRMGEAESEEATELLKSIGDFERISDHAVNILASAEELDERGWRSHRARRASLMCSPPRSGAYSTSR